MMSARDDGPARSSRDVVIVGCGGHGREIFGIIDAINGTGRPGPRWRVVGFVDDKPSAANQERVGRLGSTYLGPVDWLAELGPDTYVVLGVGDPRVRRAVAARVDAYGLPYASLIHPDATVGPDLVAGEGTVVFAGARVTTNVVLGRHVHLNQNVTVGHDCELGDFVAVHPLAAVSGNCTIASGALIGAGAVVLPGLRIGADATVGAAACVVGDVPAGVVVKGVPAL